MMAPQIPALTVENILANSENFKKCKLSVDRSIQSGQAQLANTCGGYWRDFLFMGNPVNVSCGSIALFDQIILPQKFTTVLPKSGAIGGDFIQNTSEGILHQMFYATPETQTRLVKATGLSSVYFVSMQSVRFMQGKEKHVISTTAFGSTLEELRNCLAEAITTMQVIGAPIKTASQQRPTSHGIDPELVEEAKKHKNVQGFVIAMTNAYHGTSEEFEMFSDEFFGRGEGSNMLGDAVYVSPSQEKALEYGAVLMSVHVKKTVRIIDYDQIKHQNGFDKFLDKFQKDYAKILAEWEKANPNADPDNKPSVKEYFARKFYDGIQYGEKIFAIFNPKNVLTRHQLVSIYNQAHS